MSKFPSFLPIYVYSTCACTQAHAEGIQGKDGKGVSTRVDRAGNQFKPLNQRTHHDSIVSNLVRPGLKLFSGYMDTVRTIAVIADLQECSLTNCRINKNLKEALAILTLCCEDWQTRNSLPE